MLGNTETDGERLVRLETQMRNLTEDVMAINMRIDRREGVQDERHHENTGRLQSIEGKLNEVSGAFKVGRWVINAVFAMVGGLATLALSKFFHVPMPP
jgi:hypothetical protein